MAPGASGRDQIEAHPRGGDKIEAHVWLISGVVIVGMIMSILDTTIVNVALHTLGRDLHSPISQVQWVVTGYLLALAAVIPMTGWAARRYGAKQTYLVSLVLFTLGSAACGLAGSLTALVIFRVLQGIGGGMIMPVAQLIMAQVAGPRRMGRVMAVVSMPAMLAPIFGPVIGGAILQGLHWSWIFFVNVPIGAVALVLGMLMLPHTDSGEAGKLDTLGLFLLPGPRSAPRPCSYRAPPASCSASRSRCTRCGSRARCSTCDCTPTVCSRARRSPCSGSAGHCSAR